MEIIYESVIEIEAHFILVLSDESGIIGNSIPVSSINIAYESIIHIKHKLTQIGYKIIETKADPVNTNFGNIIFGLHTSPKLYWDKSLDIAINYDLYTEKQKAVLKELRKTIPGELISYKELANRTGLSNAARFVGTTMKNNNTPLLVPCHRVVRSDGKLGFYSAPGGTDQKDKYIKLEN